MAEHEPSVGGSDDWYTPPEIFTALGLQFDLDVASPGPGHWVPAQRVYTKADDGLAQPWHGRVFMNPPFGGRLSHVPWLQKFLDHAHGIAIVRAYTSSAWFHELAPMADGLLFPKGKTKFVPSEGLRRRLDERARAGVFHNAQGHGVVILACGGDCCEALQSSGLGWYINGRGKFGNNHGT